MPEKHIEQLTAKAMTNISAEKDREYVYYHPVLNELFTLPMKPTTKAMESAAIDITLMDKIILTGIYYIGEF